MEMEFNQAKLYVMASSGLNKYGYRMGKIGITSRLLDIRKKELESDKRIKLKLHHFVAFHSKRQAYTVEKHIQNMLFRQKIKNEWFWPHSADLAWLKSIKSLGDVVSIKESLWEELESVKNGEREARVINLCHQQAA